MDDEVSLLNQLGGLALKVAEIEGVFAGISSAGDSDRAFGLYFKIVAAAASLSIFRTVDSRERLSHVKAIFDNYTGTTFEQQRQAWRAQVLAAGNIVLVPPDEIDALNEVLAGISDQIEEFVGEFDESEYEVIIRRFEWIEKHYGDYAGIEDDASPASLDEDEDGPLAEVEGGLEDPGAEVEELNFDYSELTLGRRLVIAEQLSLEGEGEDDDVNYVGDDGFHVESRDLADEASLLWRRVDEDEDWGETSAAKVVVGNEDSDPYEPDFGEREDDLWEVAGAEVDFEESQDDDYYE